MLSAQNSAGAPKKLTAYEIGDTILKKDPNESKLNWIEIERKFNRLIDALIEEYKRKKESVFNLEYTDFYNDYYLGLKKYFSSVGWEKQFNRIGKANSENIIDDEIFKEAAVILTQDAFHIMQQFEKQQEQTNSFPQGIAQNIKLGGIISKEEPSFAQWKLTFAEDLSQFKTKRNTVQ